MTASSLSYLPITAAMSSETEGIDHQHILEAVSHRDKMTYLKLMWQASASTALASREIEKLESQRQDLKKQIDSFALALIELQNAPAKNLTEEQYKQRLENIKDLSTSLNKLKKNLADMDQEITYLDDYNEDLQKRFREKMGKHLKKIDEIRDQKVEALLDYLKKQNIDVANPELRHSLKQALNSAEIQEAYLKAAGQDGKGFMNKLKGWFK